MVSFSIAPNVPTLGEGGDFHHKSRCGERMLNIAVNVERGTAPPLLPNVCWQQCFCRTNKFKTNGRYNFRKKNKQNRELQNL